jgi:RNA polymerase sigma factor (sigma-70 family)
METELNQIGPNNPDYGIALFNDYYKTVYNIAYKLTGNKEDAEDILQEVFYIALRNLPKFRGESKISTWLYTITQNAARKYLKRTAKSSFVTLENFIHTAVDAKGAEEFTALEKEYYITQVKEGCLLALIRCLNFNQRTAFILNMLANVEIRDVALIINKTSNATRILIHRAKQNIKKFLCDNCSLYNPFNPCHCQYLINFSLKNNWIQKYSSTLKRKNLTAREVENDLKEFKKFIRLYTAIPAHVPSRDFVQRIQEEILNEKYLIF